MMKRIFSILLVAALLLGMMPVSAAAAETEGIFTYSVFNGEATVTGVSSSGGTEVTIPTTLGGYPVTAIGSSAFNAAGWVTKVILPEGVTSIAEDAFSHASKLTSVKLPSTLQNIGGYAFSNCYALTDLTLPANLTSIGAYAFNQTGLSSVSIPAGMTSIADGVFQSCGNLTKVVFHENVTDIGDNAFYNCEKLEVSALPSGLKTIGSYAFCACDAFTSITIPDSVTTICDDAFASCEGLTTVTIGSGAAHILGNAFRYCAALEAFSVAAGNENFCAQNGFLYNKDKTSLICAPKTITGCEIPAGVAVIGPNAFDSCWELSTLTIPEGVTTISASAFRECENLSSLNIPASVNSIGEYAFIFSGITELTFAGNAPTMDKNALNGLESIAKYNLGSSGWEEAITQQYGGIITWTGVCTNHTYDREVAEDAYLKTEATCTSPAIYYKSCACGEEGTETFEHGEINEANHVFDANTHACACGIYGGTCGENLTWTLDENGVLTVSGTGAMEDFKSDLDTPWRSYWDDIKTVVVQNGVTHIGNCAFMGGAQVTDVTLPESVLTIGSYAFWACTSLEEIELPKSLTSIGDVAFAECSALTRMEIPENVTSIGSGIVAMCSRLTSITLAEGITSIGEYFFVGCGNLADVTLPMSVISIGEGAFNDCSGLFNVYYAGNERMWDSITISDDNNAPLFNATVHYTDLCADGHDLESHDGQDATCLEKGWKPYETCTRCYYTTYEEIPAACSHSYESVVTPPTCVSNGYTTYTCSGCGDSYVADEVPANENHTGEQGENCTACGEFIPYTGTCGENLTWIFDENGVLTISGMGEMYTYDLDDNEAPWIEKWTEIISIVVEDGVTSIGSNAFVGCDRLTSITIPKSVTSVGSGAFQGCSGLTSINIPKSVTSIGDIAFSLCSGLTSINIPESVTSIGNHVFYGCSGLTSINIPESMTSISNGAFSRCSGLTSITIPTSVTSIGDYAFSDCSGLTSITIPTSVTNIGERAFQNCKSLTSIEIPESVTRIDMYAFQACSGLKTVIFKGNAPKILGNAFYSVTSAAYYPAANATWTEDVLQNYGGTVTWKAYCQDDAHVFDQQKIDAEYLVSAATCTKKAVYHFSCACGEEGTETFEHGEINETNHAFDANMYDYDSSYVAPWFANRAEITSIVVEDGVTSIGGSAFYGCSGLTSITLPAGMTSIGYGAFQNCSGLTSINIPKSVTSIGHVTFWGCSSLTSINIPESVTSMRPYIILQDANGEQITLYGGTIYRSIGYIAYQNRKVFQPGNASYNYVWEIIHHVYGKKYDAEYKG